MPQTVLILVGIPGAGKSTIAQQLSARGWAWINQDTLGSRQACEYAAEQALREGRHVVIDRCNFNLQQRDTWLRIARHVCCDSRVRLVALNLLLPVALCISRVRSRTDHPTLGPHNCEEVCNRFAQDMVPAHLDEEFWEVYTIEDSAQVPDVISLILAPTEHAQHAQHAQVQVQPQPYQPHPPYQPYQPQQQWQQPNPHQHQQPYQPQQPGQQHYQSCHQYQQHHQQWHQSSQRYQPREHQQPLHQNQQRWNQGRGQQRQDRWQAGHAWYASAGYTTAAGSEYADRSPGYQPMQQHWRPRQEQPGYHPPTSPSPTSYAATSVLVHAPASPGQLTPPSPAHWHHPTPPTHAPQASPSATTSATITAILMPWTTNHVSPAAAAIAPALGPAPPAPPAPGSLALQPAEEHGTATQPAVAAVATAGTAGAAADAHPGNTAETAAAGGADQTVSGPGRGGYNQGRGMGRGRNRGSWPPLENPFADPASQVPYDLSGPPEVVDQIILLFDLNGTLTSHTSKRRSAGINRMRPGLPLLLKLKEKFRLGIYTSSTLRTVITVRAMLEAAAGGPLFEPGLVLFREHTAPATRDHMQAGGDPWDTVKPLARWFSKLHRVVLFDDDAYKALEGEQSNMVLVPCWLDEDPNCSMVQALVEAVQQELGGLPQDADVRQYTARITEYIRSHLPEPPADGAAADGAAADGAAGVADAAAVNGSAPITDLVGMSTFGVGMESLQTDEQDGVATASGDMADGGQLERGGGLRHSESLKALVGSDGPVLVNGESRKGEVAKEMSIETEQAKEVLTLA